MPFLALVIFVEVVVVQSLSCVWLFATPWTLASHDPLSPGITCGGPPLSWGWFFYALFDAWGGGLCLDRAVLPDSLSSREESFPPAGSPGLGMLGIIIQHGIGFPRQVRLGCTVQEEHQMGKHFRYI